MTCGLSAENSRMEDRMKKADCEKALRALCHQWARDLSKNQLKHPSFFDFKTWLRQNGYFHYLDFQSTAGAEYDAEMWFDQEFKRTWRQ